MSSADFSAFASTIQSEVDAEDSVANNWIQTLLNAENEYLANKGNYYTAIQTLLTAFTNNYQVQNELFNDILNALQSITTVNTSDTSALQGSLATYQSNQTNILNQLNTLTQNEYQNDKTLHTTYVDYFTYLLSTVGDSTTT